MYSLQARPKVGQVTTAALPSARPFVTVGLGLTAPRFRAGGAEIVLFLGCAAEDSEIASVIAAWLSEHMPETVQLWRPGESALTINAAEEHVSQAHAYIVLLSPDFLTAPLCRRERELAMCREQGLRLYFPAGTFVHVLLVRETVEPTD